MLINKDKEEVPIVPKHLTNKKCELYHDSVSAGHLGYEKTFISIQKKFYWPMMKSEIYDFCSSCDTCQKQKPKNYSNTAPLVSIQVVNPSELIGIDVAVPLKRTKHGIL